MSLTEADALYGAAYKIAFERCCPDHCTSPEFLAKAEEIGRKIKLWAAGKNAETLAAYTRGVDDVLGRARNRLENCNRAMQMAKAGESLPIPPPELIVALK